MCGYRYSKCHTVVLATCITALAVMLYIVPPQDCFYPMFIGCACMKVQYSSHWGTQLLVSCMSVPDTLFRIHCVVCADTLVLSLGKCARKARKLYLVVLLVKIKVVDTPTKVYCPACKCSLGVQCIHRVVNKMCQHDCLFPYVWWQPSREWSPKLVCKLSACFVNPWEGCQTGLILA